MAETESHPPRFTGEHERLLDSGLRVILPKDWRNLKITEFFLFTDTSSSFVKAVPGREYDKFVAKIENDATITEKERNVRLEEIGSACTRVLLDNSGRLTLPANQCAEIGISAKNPQVVLMGAVRAFSIWKPAKLAVHKQSLKQPSETGQPRISAKQSIGL